MKYSTKFLLLVVLILLGVGYFFHQDLTDSYQKLTTGLESGVDQLRLIERAIISPPPLRGPLQAQSSNLTVAGVVEQTNFYRNQEGLSSLSLNAKLSAAAAAKVNDMFAKQYFAHESPTGVGPADLAKTAGYEYILIGENLALGNFKDDAALVEAWMNSPGHRENILTPRYSEIGVAVKRGIYEGRSVWMAVQEFGRPASECPVPSKSLDTRIKSNQAKLDDFQQQMTTKREEIDSTKPKHGAEYNQRVDEYNKLVTQYNALLEETKKLISTYNNQVAKYNQCVK